jgi:hypothetical protein
MIPTVRSLSDPLKNARLYYELEPLLPKRIHFNGPLKNKMKDILDVTKKWADKPQITQSLLLYKIYHEHLAEHIEELKGQQFIFLPGSSMDMTVQRGEIVPKEIYYDAFSDRFRLSDDLIKMAITLNQKEGWNCFDDFNFIAVNHVVIPFKITRDFKIKHSLEQVVDATNEEMAQMDKDACWGAVERSLEYQFSSSNSKLAEFLYDKTHAKEIYGKKVHAQVERFKKGLPLDEADMHLLQRLFGEDEAIRNATQKSIDKFIEEHCYFNSYITAFAYKTIIKKLNIRHPVLYSRASHFSSADIFSKLELDGIELDSWAKKGIMKNADLSQTGESDSRALDFLKKRLFVFFEDKLLYKETKPEKLEPPAVPQYSEDLEIVLRPKLCTFCNRLRCRHVDRCRYEKEQTRKGEQVDIRTSNCQYDFSQNRFTKQDVAKLIDKFKLDENVDELYEELRFKDVTFKYYDEAKKKYVKRTANEFDALIEDAVEEGYTLADIPLDIAVLNSKFDEDIMLLKRGEWLSTSWVKFSNGMHITPLPVNTISKNSGLLQFRKNEFRKFELRGSEFASKCHIQRIISKMDKTKFNVLSNYYAVVGTARHKLANQRPWLHYLDIGTHHVSEYCEQTITGMFEGKFMRGTGDAFFEMSGREKNYLFVLDYKRAKKGAYEKPAYVLQLLQYAEAVKQTLNREYDGTVLCLVKRFFHGEREGENWPEYSMFFVPPGGEDEVSLPDTIYDSEKKQLKKTRLQGIENIVGSSVEIQKMILDDPKFFWTYAGFAESCELCHNEKSLPQFRNCFDTEICSAIKEKVKKGESLRDYFLPEFEL